MQNSSFENFSDYNDDFESASSINEPQQAAFTVPLTFAGSRLDAVLAKLMPDYSRNRLAEWIKQNCVRVNGKPAKPKDKMIGGEHLTVEIQPDEAVLAFTPEPMPLNIVYEDDSVIVIDKPAGLVVHPAAGNWSGTLLNGLLAHHEPLNQVPRAGIVHRLDKDTSGLMVVAKTLSAQTHLVQQLQNRTVKRIYRAVADGIVPFDGKIDTLIGRDPHNRLKMAVVKFNGKPAVTHIKVLERHQAHSYIECALETGRTHQIRVHMKAANHPLAGDPLYGNPRHPASENVKQAVRQLNRQALHAHKLGFIHPKSGETMQFESPLPEDMYHLLSVLRLESGMDSPLSKFTDDADADWDDDWNEDDYDVEVVYVKE